MIDLEFGVPFVWFNLGIFLLFGEIMLTGVLIGYIICSLRNDFYNE